MEAPDNSKEPSPSGGRRLRLLWAFIVLMYACFYGWIGSKHPWVRSVLRMAPLYGRESVFRTGEFEAHIRNDYGAPEYSFIEVRSASGGTWRAENGTFRLYDFTEKEFIDSLPRAWPPVTEVVEP
ncbi:MAG: hypothetical protein ACYTAN_03825, partial [Planctomycetota bacterium]